MRGSIIAIIICSVLLCFSEARASHIVGGEVNYKYLGSVEVGGQMYLRYQVSLSIYEDCQNGQPSAIAADNPAYLAAYVDTPHLGAWLYTWVNLDSNINYDTSYLVPVNFSNLCITNPPTVCLLKKTFTKIYQFKALPYGYVIAYQRCCRNAAIVNIQDPGNIGATYYCRIPPSTVVPFNNSATFKNYPPQIICIHNPLLYDNSAVDPDGDSLSYEFCVSLRGASSFDIKPIPSPPPYDSVNYITPPYTFQHPITGSPGIQINPVTGIITGTPSQLGRYLVTVCCHEWRGGVMINTVSREFQFVVTDCSKAVVADMPQYSQDVNTYIIKCSDYTVNFVNSSQGGVTWHWDFGVPGIFSDTSNLYQPTYTYPDTGTFIVRLNVNPHSTCTDSIWRYVKIYPYFTAGFDYSGRQCPSAPIQFNDLTASTIKPITSWTWALGDGGSSLVQNPQHIYTSGGTYNVMLVSANAKGCIDTAVKQVVIDNFVPFIGDDTTIVKGEYIQFQASGGTNYSWSPGTNLSNTSISDPVGIYPDTGSYTYYVHVESAYGCSGEDTISVHVVNQAAFLVPTAFSPNGDGKNDFFRPIAIGYRSLNYFRIFDRWGEMVFVTDNFENAWDGKYNGKPVELGVYFWELSFTDRFGKNGAMKGDVTLLR